MENTKEIESILQMKNLYFEKITFQRGETVETKLTPEFKTEYRKLEGTLFEVKLFCRILAGEKPLLELILVGVFDNQSKDPEEVEELNKINTVSIMFPYMRAEVSLITAQPNFPAITLPVFNINALLNPELLENKE